MAISVRARLPWTTAHGRHSSKCRLNPRRRSRPCSSVLLKSLASRRALRRYLNAGDADSPLQLRLPVASRISRRSIATASTMYLCGPTVYNYVHIGNARGPVVFDVLARLLRRDYGAEHVVYARNITDVDDKINAAAAQDRRADRRRSPSAIAAAYDEDMAQARRRRRRTSSHTPPRTSRTIIAMCEATDRAWACLCGRRPRAVRRRLVSRTMASSRAAPPTR